MNTGMISGLFPKFPKHLLPELPGAIGQILQRGARDAQGAYTGVVHVLKWAAPLGGLGVPLALTGAWLVAPACPDGTFNPFAGADDDEAAAAPAEAAAAAAPAAPKIHAPIVVPAGGWQWNPKVVGQMPTPLGFTGEEGEEEEGAGAPVVVVTSWVKKVGEMPMPAGGDDDDDDE